jgi:hypothetical protein
MRHAIETDRHEAQMNSSLSRANAGEPSLLAYVILCSWNVDMLPACMGPTSLSAS